VNAARRVRWLILLLLLGSALLPLRLLADDALPELLPRYLLQDPNGRAVSEADFRGRLQFITFGYTYCPDICPTTLAEMADVLKRLGDEAGRVQAIFISVDPARDSREVLRNYTAFFDSRILGLTGSPELVAAAAARFRVRYAKVSEPGAAPGQYAVDHSAGMFLLGPDGVFLQKFSWQTPTADIAARIGEHLARWPVPRTEQRP
jgi:protein SCO1/2